MVESEGVLGKRRALFTLSLGQGKPNINSLAFLYIKGHTTKPTTLLPSPLLTLFSLSRSLLPLVFTVSCTAFLGFPPFASQFDQCYSHRLLTWRFLPRSSLTIPMVCISFLRFLGIVPFWSLLFAHANTHCAWHRQEIYLPFFIFFSEATETQNWIN